MDGLMEFLFKTGLIVDFPNSITRSPTSTSETDLNFEDDIFNDILEDEDMEDNVNESEWDI